MALIEYPTDSWDAFVSLADCNFLISNNIPSTQSTGWDALTVDTDKEVYIRQATQLIKAKITLPDTLEDDLKLATAYLVNHSVGKNMLDDDNKSKVKRKKYDGAMETEYFAPPDEGDSFPDVVNNLIGQYLPTDAVSSGSFSFTRA